MIIFKKYFDKKEIVLIFFCFSFFWSHLFLYPPSTSAYTTNMSASVVVGQANFTSSTADQGGSAGANTLDGPRSIAYCNGKLIIADRTNHRILIYNSIPTSNNASADVVVGQSNFTNTTSNQGGSAAANTLSAPSGVTCVGNKLIIGDANNNRVLIYNSIPTANNASADVVVGQSTFSGSTLNQGGTCAANTLRSATDLNVYSDGSKLFIADAGNQRILIFNSIPTADNASADIVVGQSTFTSCVADQGGSAGANTLENPRDVYADGQRLYIGDLSNNRILIYNSYPTQNNTSADVVVGQSNFTSSTANQGGSVGANTLSSPRGILNNNGRLFIADTSNARVLIFNSIPTANNASADIVMGQVNFTSNSANQGGSARANTFNNPYSLFTVNNEKLVLSDLSNNRILIFENIIRKPGLTLNNSPEGRVNNQLRLKGTATVDSLYTIKSVEFSVNGSSFSGATATDGDFNETNEDFYFDFDPTTNQPRDSSGNLIEGYTIRVRSTNNNTDVTDRLFYFSPFDMHLPLDFTTVSTAYPKFEFSVNKQRTNLLENLSKYQVQVRKGGSDSTASWETLIDDIPIDFRSVKNERTNKQWEVWGHLDTNNGVYETDKFYATYSEESSRIKVYSKVNAMSGTYQWKVVAVDKSGHTQETGVRNLFVTASASGATNYFPLAVLHISGLGNPNMNSYNLLAMKDIYYTTSSHPTFYGIAWTNSKVTLQLNDQNCPATASKLDCTKTYSTITNTDSRFGINVPKGELIYGKHYTTNLSVALEGKYNELPQFTLSIGGSIPQRSTTILEETEAFFATPSPMPKPTNNQIVEPTPVKSKKCFLWIFCF